MSLENLVGISLDRIDPSQETVKRLLAAAERNIKDSQIRAVSAENRFDAAYKAIMQLGIVACPLPANAPTFVPSLVTGIEAGMGRTSVSQVERTALARDG